MLNYGIQVEVLNKAPKVVALQSSALIALIGTSNKEKGVYLYEDIKKAIAENTSGTLKEALKDLDACGVERVLISAFEIKNNNTYDLPKAIEAIEALKDSENITGEKPRFILAPEINDSGFVVKLREVSEFLRAIYFYEVTKGDIQALKSAIATETSSRAIVSFQKLLRLDKVTRPASAFFASLYAKELNASDMGFSTHISSKIIPGVIGVVDYVKFNPFMVNEADQLRKEGFTLAIFRNGIRSWGGESKHEVIKSVRSQVILDVIIESILQAQAYAIDRKINDVLGEIIDSLHAFYRRLKGGGVLIDFEVDIPRELNSKESLSQGQIYIKHTIQEVPTVSKVINRIYLVNKYSTQLLDNI